MVRVDTMSLRNNVTKAEICCLTTEYYSVILYAAESAGMLKQVKVFPAHKKCRKTISRVNDVKRPWFNDECRTLRNQYKIAEGVLTHLKIINI